MTLRALHILIIYFKVAWLGLIIHAYRPITQEAQERSSQVQGPLWQQSKLGQARELGENTTTFCRLEIQSFRHTWEAELSPQPCKQAKPQNKWTMVRKRQNSFWIYSTPSLCCFITRHGLYLLILTNHKVSFFHPCLLNNFRTGSLRSICLTVLITLVIYKLL